eukprot:scaffold295063_cov31-Tisochrysis_lutea.AAC.1
MDIRITSHVDIEQLCRDICESSRRGASWTLNGSESCLCGSVSAWDELVYGAEDLENAAAPPQPASASSIATIGLAVGSFIDSSAGEI